MPFGLPGSWLSHRHASSSFVTVQTRAAQSWQDLARTSVLSSAGNDLKKNKQKKLKMILDIQRQPVGFAWFWIYATHLIKSVISRRNTSHPTTSELTDCCPTAWFTDDLLLIYCWFVVDLLLIYCWFTVDGERPVNRDGHIRAKRKSPRHKQISITKPPCRSHRWYLV